MATKQPSNTNAPTPADAQDGLAAAQAQLQAATERHAAVTSALSRLGASAADKRQAQAEKKKVDHALREAQRLVAQAQAR